MIPISLIDYKMETIKEPPQRYRSYSNQMLDIDRTPKANADNYLNVRSFQDHLDVNQSLMSSFNPMNQSSSHVTQMDHEEGVNLNRLSVFRENSDERKLVRSYTFTHTFDCLKSMTTKNIEKTLKDHELLKSFLRVREQTLYEKIDEMNDEYFFLNIRNAILRIKNAFSQLSTLIVSSPIFEAIIVTVILLNAALLALEDPNSNNGGVLEMLDLFFLYVYTVECGLKILAYGLVFDKESYFRDSWNILDFIIVSTAWLMQIGQSSINLAALRTLRILRPLRSISSIKGLRVIFTSLIGSI